MLIVQINVTDLIAIVTYDDTTPVKGISYEKESEIQIDANYYLKKFSNNPVENPDDLNTGGVNFYLIRIVGENEQQSYIGPIWVAVT